MGWEKALGVCSSGGWGFGNRSEQNGEQNYLTNKPRKEKKGNLIIYLIPIIGKYE